MKTFKIINNKNAVSSQFQEIEVNRFELNKNLAQPLYMQLAIQLQTLIESHEFDQAKPLPSIDKCYRMLGISKSTVFQAYTYLNKNGLVHWKKGQGFYAK
ncbi:MAG: GntR family transcriptional regulator [Bacteroidota bacterium]|nr:GntR family transcriptional regulator [Bacteroidota bacterium]